MFWQGIVYSRIFQGVWAKNGFFPGGRRKDPKMDQKKPKALKRPQNYNFLKSRRQVPLLHPSTIDAHYSKDIQLFYAK